MRRRRFFIVALTAIITFVTLQAFIGHRYHGPFGRHGWHHRNGWYGPQERYGPGWRQDDHYNRWNDSAAHR